MITGSLKADNGKIYIDGEKVNHQFRGVTNIGFCPQFDILWSMMTVKEHFIFMNLFKGKSFKQSKKLAKTMIVDVGLSEDDQKIVDKLSGGMRRRVSMGMALSANPRIVIMDEPSSGLDPVKRREFWKLLKRLTLNKAVLLTTHLMEEADALCSEIAIMTTGVLRCTGNSLFLKKTFTKGIRIDINLKDKHASQQEIDQFMEKVRDHFGDNISLESEFRGCLQLILKEKNLENPTGSSPDSRVN